MILVIVLVFFALTRTQVGRDGLRLQLMRNFATQYEGRLEIDRLSGNLVSDLFAGGVRLYDARGALVLSADSVVAEPSWRDLFRRRVTLGRLTLYHPTLSLIRTHDGSWNLSEALRRTRRSAAGGGDRWSFTSLHLSVLAGAVEVRNDGDVPALVRDGHLFDFTNTRVSDVNARATVDWQTGTRVLELQSASARLSALDLDLSELQGQVVFESDEVLVPMLAVVLGNSRGALSGALTGRSALQQGEYEAVTMQAYLSDAVLDNAELRRLFPSYPLRDRMSASVRIQGALAGIVVEELELSRGESRLQLEGHVQGLPEKADFEAAFRNSRLTAEDLHAVAPSLASSAFARVGSISFSAEGLGVVPLPYEPSARGLSVVASWTATAASGSTDGSLEIHDGQTHRYEYAARASADGLDLATLLGKSELTSRLQGVVMVSGEADDLTGHRTTLSARLAPSDVAHRSIDTLRAEIDMVGSTVHGVVLARQGRAGVTGRVRAQLNAVPAYDLTLSAFDLDAGPLLMNDSLRTDLNGTVRITGDGRTWDTFRGRLSVALDSSSVALGDVERFVLPQQTSVSIMDGDGGGTDVQVSGDVVEASLAGTTNAKILFRAATLWTRLLARAVYRDVFRPYPGLAELAPDENRLVAEELERPLAEERLRVIALHRPTGSVGFTGRVHVKNAAAVSALFPELPPLATDLRATFSMRSDTSRMHGEMSLLADSLRMGGTRLTNFSAEAGISGSLGAGAERTVSIHVTSKAALVESSERTLHGASVDLMMNNGTGHLRFASGNASNDSLKIAARLQALDDRLRLTLERFRYAAGGYVWLNAEEDEVDLYQGAAVIRDLRLVNEDRDRDVLQRIEIGGAFSSVPGDTVVLTADDIALHQLASAFSGPALGGTVSGRVALTGGPRRPELTGHLDVEHLRVDDRLLGDLSVRSRYVPGAPDVQIDAALSPSDDNEAIAQLSETNPLRIEDNLVQLTGRLRMPEFDERARQIRASELDLALNAERADIFFFEYLFPQLTGVSGYVSAGGRITGSLDDPVFDVNVQLAEAEFSVPDYNLRFAATADGFIDREGIHITEGKVTDKSGGTASVRGGILFNEYRFFSFDLAARLDEIQIMDVTDARRGLSFYGRIWASGNATLTGPLSSALLQSSDVVTAPRSEIYIPLTEVAETTDPGFILFADSSGNVPDFSSFVRRDNILARRPAGERRFIDALGMDLNIFAPPGSTVHLVIDPLLGDMMNAVGTGRIQLLRSEGEYLTFGSLDVSAGDYLFTAGDVFIRRFLIDEGTIRWDGDPTDAQLDVWASYRTRASTAGLPGLGSDAESSPLIPLLVRLHITARVSSPSVELSLALERRDQDVVGQGLEAILNDPERSTQYATSVLLTNTFLLTTDQFAEGNDSPTGTRNQFAFSSVSQLVASQINRYLSYALPNVDVNFGVQGERAQDLDVTYGVALRLMDERLIIRGEGVYQNDQQNSTRGEFLVQVRLSPGVSVEMFYRREGDVLSDQTLTNTTGAGVSYETRFSNWDRLIKRLFGWAQPEEEHADEEAAPPVAAQSGK